MKQEHCPLCGSKSYFHKIKSMTLHYKSHPITVKQPGYWCDSCKEGIIGNDDHLATQKELQSFKAKIDGLLSPDEIKLVREKLNLTQKNASEFFGGGINAFSRYERGETPVPKPLCQLLLLLYLHPDLFVELNKNTIRISIHKSRRKIYK